MSIVEYFGVLRRGWRLIALCVLFTVGIAAAATVSMPKTYVSTTTLFVRGVPGDGPGAEYEAAKFAADRAESYAVLISNPDLLSGVVDDLDLTVSPGQLRSQLIVDNPTDSPLVTVSALGATPEDSRDLATAAADRLAELIIELETAGVDGGVSPIEVQVAVPAAIPSAPDSPRVALNLLLGLLGGLTVGSIWCVLRDARRREVTSTNQTEPTGDEPVSVSGSGPDAVEGGGRHRHRLVPNARSR